MIEVFHCRSEFLPDVTECRNLTCIASSLEVMLDRLLKSTNPAKLLICIEGSAKIFISVITFPGQAIENYCLRSNDLANCTGFPP
jgi:hypothetical protein